MTPDELKRLYQRVFDTEDGRQVLKSLGTFCKNDRTSVMKDFNPYACHYNEGKREVYLYIQRTMKGKVNE